MPDQNKLLEVASAETLEALKAAIPPYKPSSYEKYNGTFKKIFIYAVAAFATFAIIMAGPKWPKGIPTEAATATGCGLLSVMLCLCLGWIGTTADTGYIVNSALVRYYLDHGEIEHFNPADVPPHWKDIPTRRRLAKLASIISTCAIIVSVFYIGEFFYLAATAAPPWNEWLFALSSTVAAAAALTAAYLLDPTYLRKKPAA